MDRVVDVRSVPRQLMARASGSRNGMTTEGVLAPTITAPTRIGPCTTIRGRGRVCFTNPGGFGVIRLPRVTWVAFARTWLGA